MTYTYPASPRATSLVRRLERRAEAYAEAMAYLDEARKEATSALAEQLRAERASKEDRDLVQSTVKRDRERRLAR